jgi:uncharacterized C2H2 Zn-finger protein
VVSPLAISLLAPVVIVLVAVVLVFAGRRKLRCPNCGNVFSAPSMDNKNSGLGLTLPFMGKVKCPKCGESRPRRDYQKPDAPSPAAT